MDFPPEIVEKNTIVSGGAYRQLKQYSSDTNPKLRFFFILNQTPETDDELIIVTATTKIEKTVRKFFHGGLVFVNPEEYDSLPEPSVLNCNLAIGKTKATLLEEIARGQVRCIAPMPESVLQRCRTAIAAVPTVSDKHKRLVLGEEQA